MEDQWTTLRIVECSEANGETASVILQSNGRAERYVLGNGRSVEMNADGSFTEPQSRNILTVLDF